MTATIQSAPILDRAGLPKITKRQMILLREDGAVLGRQVFNPNSACSRSLARSRLVASAHSRALEVRS